MLNISQVKLKSKREDGSQVMVNPSTQERHLCKFQDSQGYIGKSYLKNKTKNKNPKLQTSKRTTGNRAWKVT